MTTEARIKEKKLNQLAWLITLVVLILVGLMRRVKIDVGMDLSFLAPFHSTVNGITFFVLVFALFQIKRGNIALHRKAIYTAMSLSVIFLTSYVLYHFTTPEKTYCGVGGIRVLYFSLLISHIILAAVVLPLVLFTFTRAYTGQYERHKKMARYVMPLWMYVCASGPVCFLMLKDCPGS